jgi:hypothetical protein
VNEQRQLKLIDFGFSHYVIEGRPFEVLFFSFLPSFIYLFLQILGGTPIYSPPDPKMSYGWDIWACGIVLYVMLFSTFPFSLVDLEMGNFLFPIPKEKKISDGLALGLFDFPRISLFSSLTSVRFISRNLNIFPECLSVLVHIFQNHLRRPSARGLLRSDWLRDPLDDHPESAWSLLSSNPSVSDGPSKRNPVNLGLSTPSELSINSTFYETLTASLSTSTTSMELTKIWKKSKEEMLDAINKQPHILQPIYPSPTETDRATRDSIANQPPVDPSSTVNASFSGKVSSNIQNFFSTSPSKKRSHEDSSLLRVSMLVRNEEKSENFPSLFSYSSPMKMDFRPINRLLEASHSSPHLPSASQPQKSAKFTTPTLTNMAHRLSKRDKAHGRKSQNPKVDVDLRLIIPKSDGRSSSLSMKKTDPGRKDCTEPRKTSSSDAVNDRLRDDDTCLDSTFHHTLTDFEPSSNDDELSWVEKKRKRTAKKKDRERVNQFVETEVYHEGKEAGTACLADEGETKAEEMKEVEGESPVAGEKNVIVLESFHSQSPAKSPAARKISPKKNSKKKKLSLSP